MDIPNPRPLGASGERKPLTDDEKDLIASLRRGVDAISRTNFLTNAGGVIATLSFVGTTWGKQPELGKWPLIPLAFFILGLGLCGFANNARLLLTMDSAYDETVRNRDPSLIGPKLPAYLDLVLKNSRQVFSVAANASTFCFWFGSVAGWILLLKA